MADTFPGKWEGEQGEAVFFRPRQSRNEIKLRPGAGTCRRSIACVLGFDII